MIQSLQKGEKQNDSYIKNRIGLIILYLFACTVTIFYYYLNGDLDDIKNLPRYITIPGIICVAILAFATVMLVAYIAGGIFIG